MTLNDKQTKHRHEILWGIVVALELLALCYLLPST